MPSSSLPLSYMSHSVNIRFMYIFFIAVSVSNFTEASCSLDESINLADNSNDDNDNHHKCCQTENVVLAEEYCQTDLDMAQLDRQQIYMQDITDELSSTKGQLLSVQLTEDGFRDNDDKTKFYTGIPKFSLLMHVLNLIAPHIKRNTQNALGQFQEFLLVLIRLKLNSPLQDLAYRFNISVPTAHRIFDRWIHVMSVRLKFLIQWPEHEELQATMPVVFQRNFGKKVAVIIDCFEIFTERPSSLIARAMTWSNYKHHNTVKFLIGVTPQGVISFISKAWGGRVSDKYLTENSGLLRKLLPGDIVFADGALI